MFGRRAAERRGTPADLLVVGLGNPGDRYRGTRHNVGFEVVELLSSRHGGSLRGEKRIPARTAEVSIDGARVLLGQPTTYMNRSGEAVGPLVTRGGITDPERLVVVHDELDLPVGRLRVKVGGGLAGHNGLRSILEHCHSEGFTRIRIGVGKPPEAGRGRDHVLAAVPRAERAVLDRVVAAAADAVGVLVAEGVAAAMERFNGLDLRVA